jgi:hypothetical protein
VHPRGFAVDRHHAHAEAGQVAVSVDEAREHRSSTQLDFSCTRISESSNVWGAAHGKDTSAAGNRLNDVIAHIDSVDVAAGEDDLRRGTVMPDAV